MVTEGQDAKIRRLYSVSELFPYFKRPYAAAPQCVSAGVSVNNAKKAALALFTRVFTFTHCGAIHATSAPERVI